MNREQIKEMALANGFKLKQQPGGEMDLNPYVYEFAEALVDTLLPKSVPGCFEPPRMAELFNLPVVKWQHSKLLRDQSTRTIDQNTEQIEAAAYAINNHDSMRAANLNLGRMLNEQAAEIERLLALSDRLKQEAEIHAQEARTQRSTVHSIYQAIGAQKGDWNGAEPVIEAFVKLKQEREQLDSRNIQLAQQLSYVVSLADEYESEHGNTVFWKDEAVKTLEESAVSTAAHDAEAINIARARTRQAWISSNSAEEYDFALAKYANQLIASGLTQPQNTLRGHPMHQDADGVWRFDDTGEPTETSWFNRPCGHCGASGNSNDGLPDPCLGQLPGVTNACCGHGDPSCSYICFKGGVVVRGFRVERNASDSAEEVKS